METRLGCFFYVLFLMGIRVNSQLNIVHITDEFEAGSGTISFEQVVSQAIKDSGAKVAASATIIVKATMTEAQICAAILEKVPAPSFVIDSTQQYKQTTSKSSAMVKNVLRQLRAPTLSTTPGSGIWPGLTKEEAVYMVSLPQPGSTMLEVVRSLAVTLKMKNLMVLYDKNFDPAQRMGTLLQNTNTEVMFRELKDDENERKELIEEIYLSDICNVVILGTITTFDKAIVEIKAREMFKPSSKWFLITKDAAGDIVCTNCGNSSMLYVLPTLTNPNAENLKHSFGSPQKVDTAFYYDLTRSLVEGVTAKADWPTLTYSACGENFTTEQLGERAKADLNGALNNSPFVPAYGKFSVAENSQNKQLLKLSLKHKYTTDSDVKTDEMGTWTAEPKTYGKLEPAANFVQLFTATRLLRITTMVHPPFIYHDNVTGAFTGLCIDMIDMIRTSDVIQFEYRIFLNEHGLTGFMKPNDPAGTDTTKGFTWQGMVADLINKKADIALGPLAVMAERETAIDFTVPFYDLVGISVLMRKPDVKSSLFKFLTVLETNVWGCILGAYFFTSILMYLFDRLSPYSFHNNREKLKDDPENRDFNLKECLWFCMTSLTPQGGGEAPRNLSGRLVAATWWLFGFIIIASYTANLAAFLTVSRLDSTIESLEDLARQYKVKYAPVRGTESYTYFERMSKIEERFYEIWKNMSLDDTLNVTERAKLAVWDYPVSDKYTKIWWTMTENGPPETFEEGVLRVQKRIKDKAKDSFALVGDATRIRYTVMTNCMLKQVGNEFSRKPLALGVQAGSGLKDALSTAILRLVNERKIEGLKEKWWANNPARVFCDDREKETDGIGIANIGGVFIVICIGMILAVLTLLIEYCYFTSKRKVTRVIAVKDLTLQGKENMKR